MIVKIEGILEAVHSSTALVHVQGGITYGVLLPAYTAARLGGSIGQSVKLHTLYFIESQGQGTTMVPRLAGFTEPQDREFFELFTTCKGIGNRRALRAMTMSTGQIAEAIVDRDTAFLQSLPEIGRRTAETIIVTLRGKADRFVTAPADEGQTSHAQSTATQRQPNISRDALKVLLQLGENRTQAMSWIQQAISSDDPPDEVQQLVSLAYQMKAAQG